VHAQRAADYLHGLQLQTDTGPVDERAAYGGLFPASEICFIRRSRDDCVVIKLYPNDREEIVQEGLSLQDGLSLIEAEILCAAKIEDLPRPPALSDDLARGRIRGSPAATLGSSCSNSDFSHVCRLPALSLSHA
jgi:hypothetical protein